MSKVLKTGIIAAILIFISTLFILRGSQGSVNVVVAAKDINPDTKITADMLKVESVAAKSVMNGAITNKNDLIGKTIRVGRVTGDQIPKDIVEKNDFLLGSDEIFMNIPVQTEDAINLSAGNIIGLIYYSGNSGSDISSMQVQLISDIKVYQISQQDVSNNKNTVITIIISKSDAEKLAPYIKNNSFKIIREQ